MSQNSSHQLTVDMLRRDAYGYCAEMLPELVEFDEWGYPIVRNLARISHAIAYEKICK
jgi:ferredoxin